MLIGLAGLTCSGKEDILSILINKYKNYILIDSSKIYTLLLKDPLCIAELTMNFNKLINKNQKITKETLNNIIMSGSKDAKELNNLLLRYTNKIIKNIKNTESDSKLIIINVTSLTDFDLINICDKVIISIASDSIRAQRLSERINIPYDMALNRISIQRPIAANLQNSIYISTDNKINKESIFNFINYN